MLVPQFHDQPERVLTAAQRAEDMGLDGVFVFDHLWAPGRTTGPSLSAFPLLGAIAAVTRRVQVGTLVSRVGVVGTSKLVSEFCAVQWVAGERLVAGLGVGDRHAEVENAAYGVPVRPLTERLALLDETCGALDNAGISVWVGGRSAKVQEVAARHHLSVNLWDGGPADVIQIHSDIAEVTWAGRLDLGLGIGPESPESPESKGLDQAVQRLIPLVQAGCTWFVVSVAGSAADPSSAIANLAWLRDRLEAAASLSSRHAIPPHQ